MKTSDSDLKVCQKNFAAFSVWHLLCHFPLLEYETITDIIWKDFDVPLPGMKRRDATLARMWVPDFLTQDATSGSFLSWKPVAHEQLLCFKHWDICLWKTRRWANSVYEKHFSSLSCLILPTIFETQNPCFWAAHTSNVSSNTKVFVIETQELPLCARLKQFLL